MNLLEQVYTMPMNTNDLTVSTPPGGAVIEGPVPADKLSTMVMCSEMNNFRPSNTQLQSLVRITKLPRGRVYIARLNQTIIGYVTFHEPDDDCPWGEHGKLIEMGGIEVARQWRCCQTATALLEYIFCSNYWESYIVIGLACCRHWDLQGNNLTIWEYRKMLDKLVRQVNFTPGFTTMYDILEHPANSLIARCGIKVNRHDWELFNQLASYF